MRLKILIFIGLLFASSIGTMQAQDYIDKNVKQPSYQNNSLGGGFSNFLRRIELEVGGSVINNKYTHWKEQIDGTDYYYKVTETNTEKETKPIWNAGINTYFPLVQPSVHKVYGLGVGAYAEMTDFYLRDETRLTNISMPIVFYSKFGADAAFDSRTRYSWGWGLGYVPSYFMLDAENSTVVGYPIVYLEGGIFAGSSMKLRLTSNLGYKYRVDNMVDADSFGREWQTSEYQIFPFRLSLLWTPGSIGWERNKWSR